MEPLRFWVKVQAPVFTIEPPQFQHDPRLEPMSPQMNRIYLDSIIICQHCPPSIILSPHLWQHMVCNQMCVESSRPWLYKYYIAQLRSNKQNSYGAELHVKNQWAPGPPSGQWSIRFLLRALQVHPCNCPFLLLLQTVCLARASLPAGSPSPPESRHVLTHFRQTMWGCEAFHSRVSDVSCFEFLINEGPGFPRFAFWPKFYNSKRCRRHWAEPNIQKGGRAEAQNANAVLAVIFICAGSWGHCTMGIGPEWPCL